jgi:hypothetical protein
VRTLRHAAALLAGADTSAALGALASALGFVGEPAPLDARTRDAIRVPVGFQDARIVNGAGTLRALLLTAPNHTTFRDAVGKLATQIARGAPHLLVLLIVRSMDGAHLALAAWSADRGAPRVAALIVDRARVLESDAETFRALAASAGHVDVLTHARWIELLGRESLTRRFYHALEGAVGTMAASIEAPARAADDANEVALLYASRLLFLCFLQAKGWLNGKPAFLASGFDECMAEGGHYHRRVMLPLLFGTLNTPRRSRSAAALALGEIPFLNGGLFARTPAERRLRTARISDDAFGHLFGDVLLRYRFTAREDRAAWSEAAIDPEMLGKAFESLMASRERRATGAFYTPQTLVADVTRAAFVEALSSEHVARDVAGALLDGATVTSLHLPRASVAHARERIAALRVLDPACGSGAFLVHALERLCGLLAALGDERATGALRREVLTRSIFGVDVNPTAVWLCELRLWLSVVIDAPDDDPRHVPPLPNLDHNVRVGDALAGGAFGTTPVRGSARVRALRDRYVRSTGARKLQLARALDREERLHALAVLDADEARTAALRRSLLFAMRGRDLFGERHAPAPLAKMRLTELREHARRIRAQHRALSSGAALPFTFAAHFADAATNGGFDVVIGNPPWVRTHRIDPRERAGLRRDFAVLRAGGWAHGAASARAGAGFAAQVDLSAMFVERSISLLRDGGALSLLLPVKLWHSLAGGGLRSLLQHATTIRALEDWSESRAVFDAAVYPSMLTAVRCLTPPARGAPSTPSAISAALHHRDRALRWEIEPVALSLDDTPGSPWLLVPPDVRKCFDHLVRAGVPLAESELGRPLLGTKCGLNAAFIVTSNSLSPKTHRNVESDVTIRAESRTGVIESHMLRPLLRGEGVSAWRQTRPTDEYLVWTHGDDGAPLRRLPPLAERWLRPWRRDLEARSDGQGRARWWSLFRTEGAAANLPRVVWCDIGRTPRALVLDAGDPTVPLNSCYVQRCRDTEDALAFAALLNSALAASWLGILAEPARGGYHRYLGWTMALLPIPRDWPHARALLAPLGRRARDGETVTPHELLVAAVRAYRVRPDDLVPMLEWTSRA